MKKILTILAIISFIAPILFISTATAVDPSQVITATDQMLYENYGIDSGHDYAMTNIEADTLTQVITLKTGYTLLGIGVYTSANAMIEYMGPGIDCVDSGASADSLTVCFNPAETYTYWPFKSVTSVNVYSVAGDSCDVYISVRAKR